MLAITSTSKMSCLVRVPMALPLYISLDSAWARPRVTQNIWTSSKYFWVLLIPLSSLFIDMNAYVMYKCLHAYVCTYIHMYSCCFSEIDYWREMLHVAINYWGYAINTWVRTPSVGVRSRRDVWLGVFENQNHQMDTHYHNKKIYWGNTKPDVYTTTIFSREVFWYRVTTI